MEMATRLPMASSVCRESTDPETPTQPTTRMPMRSGMKANCCAASKRGSPRRQINWRSLDSNPSMLGPERYMSLRLASEIAAERMPNESTM